MDIEKTEEEEDISGVGKRKNSCGDSRSRVRRESNDEGVSNRKERSQKGEGKSEKREEGEKEGKEKVKAAKQEGGGVGEDKTDRLSGGLSEPCAAGDYPKASASCTDSSAPLVAAADTAAAAGSVDKKLTTQPPQNIAAAAAATTTTTTITTTVEALTSISTEAKATCPVVRRSPRLTATATTTTTPAAAKASAAAAVAAEVSSKFKRPHSSFSPSSTLPLLPPRPRPPPPPSTSSSSSSSSSSVSGSSHVFQSLKRPLSLVQTPHPLPASPSKLLAKATTTAATTTATTTTATTTTATTPKSDGSSSVFSPLSSLLFSSSSSPSSLTRPLRVTAPASGPLPPALKPRLSLTNSEPPKDKNIAPAPAPAPALAPEPSQSQEVSATIPDISEQVVTKVNSCENDQTPQQRQGSVLTDSETDSNETETNTEPPSDPGLDTGLKPLGSPTSDLDQTDFSQSNDRHVEEEEEDTFQDILSYDLKKIDFELGPSKKGSDIWDTMKQVSNDKAMSESDLSVIAVTRTLTNETARHKLLLRRKSSLAQRQRPSRLKKRPESGSDSDNSRPNTGDELQDLSPTFNPQLKDFHENEKFDTDSSIEKIPEKITDYLPKVSNKYGDPGLELKREKNLENEAVFGTQSSVHSRNLYNNDSDKKVGPNNYIKETDSQTEKSLENSLSSKRTVDSSEAFQLSQPPPDFPPPPLLSSPPSSSPDLFSPPPAPAPESVEQPHVPFRRFRPPHLRKALNKNNPVNALEESVDKNWQNSLNELNTRISRKSTSSNTLTESTKGPRILRTKSSIERQIYRNLVEPEISNEKDLSKTEEESSGNDKKENLLIEDYKKPKSISESNYSFDVKSVLRKVPPNAKEKSPNDNSLAPNDNSLALKDNSLAPKEPLFKNLEARRSTSFVHLERKSDNKVQKDPPWLKDFSGKRVGRIFSKFDCVKSPTEKEPDEEHTPHIRETYQTSKNDINGAEITKSRSSSLFTSSSTPPKDPNQTPVSSENKKPVINKERKELPSSPLSPSPLQKPTVDNRTESKLNESRSTPTAYRRKSQESDKISPQRKSVSSTQNSAVSVSSISEAVPDWKKKLAEKNKIKRESFSKVDDISQNKTDDASTVQPAWRQKLANKNRSSQSIDQSDKKASEKPEWIRKAEERRARVSQSNLLKN